MKSTVASTLASFPLLALVLAMEVPHWQKMSLGGAACKNIHLTDNYVLHAQCVNPSARPEPPTDLSLDLNACFANYLGTLNYVPDGGFGASCSECHLDDKNKLICQCGIGEGMGSKETTYDLDNWKTIRIAGYSSPELGMSCHTSDYIEKRTDDKEARPFVM